MNPSATLLLFFFALVTIASSTLFYLPEEVRCSGGRQEPGERLRPESPFDVLCLYDRAVTFVRELLQFTERVNLPAMNKRFADEL